MEFGLHESLPLYSGGLGILAGDHLKAASDVGIPLTAVGIFLRDGYFKQYFDSDNRQLDEYPSIDATEHPFEPVLDQDGRPVVVTVHSGWTPVHLRAWKLRIGRVDLYLLDADFDANGYDVRFLTRRLYQGDRRTRLQQEIILGIGGMRLLRLLELDFDVFHMNEGHCAFLTLEMLSRLDGPGAADQVRSKCVFTTHTPVMAGHDRFDPDLFLEQMGHFREELKMSEREMLSFGRINPDDDSESFTMTVLGLKLSRSANGVSRLNGEVARRQWQHLYPGLRPDEVPIGYVTNGIHLPTWTSSAARSFLSEHLGDWESNRADPQTWARVDSISDADLWQYRCTLRQRLIEYTKQRIAHQTAKQEEILNPDALTIGFARRFATYKRAPLFFTDLERAARILNNADRPVQFLYAGKAHPADRDGQEFIRHILEYTHQDAFRGRVVFLEDYNMEVGRMLVSGCDIWLNNPRRPYEASGTSGQKVAIHGGLNLSILDGWWAEGYSSEHGWAIGHEASHTYKDPAVQDPEDAEYLYRILETEVIPTFFDRDADGVPVAWARRMKHAIQELSYEYSAHRMIVDYINSIYQSRTLKPSN